MSKKTAYKSIKLIQLSVDIVNADVDAETSYHFHRSQLGRHRCKKCRFHFPHISLQEDTYLSRL